MNKKLRNFIIKIIVLISIAGLFLLLNKLFFNLKPEDIQKWVESFGGWAPVILMGIFAIRPFTLIPLSIIALSSGLIFGPYMGTLYNIIGTLIGAATSFAAVRIFTEEAHIEDRNLDTLKEFKNDLEENGFKSVLMLRLIPALNFDLLTFFCAKMKVIWWKFLLATLVGTIPGSFMFGYFGSSLLKLKPMNLIILAGIIVVLVLLAYLTKRQLGSKYDLDELKDEMKELKN